MTTAEQHREHAAYDVGTAYGIGVGRCVGTGPAAGCTDMADAVPVDVSVILPVYNEAPHLSAELDRIASVLEDSSYSWEILVVDDGSTDGSADRVSDWISLRAADRVGDRAANTTAGQAVGQAGCRDDVRLLRSARNRGSGSARRVGTLASRGRVVVWTDADMTYPNHRIPELVDALDGADQIVGARTSEAGTLKLLRVPAKWAIRRLASYLTRTRIPDLNSGFRAMRRAVAVQFIDQLPTGFSCVTTITMAFLSNGYSVRYTPIDYRERKGRSKFHWWADTRRYVLQVVRMMLSHDPLRVFMPIAVLLGTAFAIKLGYDLTEKNLRIAANTLLLGFASVQLLALGLLADLVVRSTRIRHLIPPADVVEINLSEDAPELEAGRTGNSQPIAADV